ncbi:hypothetical protein HPP92_021539 [Vanilla planifolia]|uniref:Uncharacterized protein n=1 Tax=Vanilla planifolia TaxID=51239 RepID=A0A835Q1R7_VANPL|nr:hypothetical protein HPP92_021539 [Vanilla planifolia]
MEETEPRSFRRRSRKQSHPRCSFHNPIKELFEEKVGKKASAPAPPTASETAVATKEALEPPPSPVPPSPKTEHQPRSSARIKRTSPPDQQSPAAEKKRGKRKRVALVGAGSSSGESGERGDADAGETVPTDKTDSPAAATEKWRERIRQQGSAEGFIMKAIR